MEITRTAVTTLQERVATLQHHHFLLCFRLRLALI